MFQLENIVVNDVIEIESLTLDANVISIEGQSGSGKSTLLRLLNNLDEPTSGNVYLQNKNIKEIPPGELRKRVVMLPQTTTVFDGTIRDNLIIGLTFSEQPIPADKDLNEMLKKVWIDKALDTSASDLSGGEQQRMALARLLLMKETEVFLLDEPSSDLDNKTMKHVMKEFIQVTKERNQQIIMVTHDTTVSKNFADSIINMDTYSKQIEAGDE